MKHLYYTRHGESVVNINGVWATQVGTKLDRGLTKVGRKQAIKAGKEAAREGLCVDVMLVSPLMRAQETAEILADILGCKNLETLELLTERNFGSLEGTELADFL